jgi:hypothetical protein
MLARRIERTLHDIMILWVEVEGNRVAYIRSRG